MYQGFVSHFCDSITRESEAETPLQVLKVA